jgi:hypothetical protein
MTNEKIWENKRLITAANAKRSKGLAVKNTQNVIGSKY